MKLNEITIEITQQCPNCCIYCSSFSDIGKTERLDYDCICRVVDDAKELGVKSVSLSGGEPFLRKDLSDIVDYINAKELKVRLYSSGIYYDNGKQASIPSIMLEAIKGKLEALIFNYETIDAELYATIMGSKTANMTLLNETIRSAVKLEIPVEAHLVPMHCNYRQIPEVISELYSMGVSNVSILRLVSQGRVIDNRDLVELKGKEQTELIQILNICKETYNDKIRLGLPFSSERVFCGTGISKLIVRYDGFVFPCEAFKDGMMELENRMIPENVKENRLKNIYHQSAYLQSVRNSLNEYVRCEGDEYCYGQYCRTVKR